MNPNNSEKCKTSHHQGMHYKSQRILIRKVSLTSLRVITMTMMMRSNGLLSYHLAERNFIPMLDWQLLQQQTDHFVTILLTSLGFICLFPGIVFCSSTHSIIAYPELSFFDQRSIPSHLTPIPSQLLCYEVQGVCRRSFYSINRQLQQQLVIRKPNQNSICNFKICFLPQ